MLNADASVAAVFDVCHMLKLARNCLNEYQILVAPGDGQIRREYVRLLQKKQNLEGLNLANKVTLFHVQYKKPENESSTSGTGHFELVCLSFGILEKIRIPRVFRYSGN